MVRDVSAVQTLSRLNRKYPEKEETITIDFTNNVKEIFKAFKKYRGGDPFLESEPNPEILNEIYKAILQTKVFSKKQIGDYAELVKKAIKNPKLDAPLMDLSSKYKKHFLTHSDDSELRKDYVKLLNRYVALYYFVTKFYKLHNELEDFLIFAETIKDKLLKEGTVSTLKRYLKDIKLEKGAVIYQGKFSLEGGEKDGQKKPESNSVIAAKLPKVTIPDIIEKIKEKYPIADKNAIVIREICTEHIKNENNQKLVKNNLQKPLFLRAFKKGTLRKNIIGSFFDRRIEDRLKKDLYIEEGGIIDLMSSNIVEKISMNGDVSG